MELAEIIGRVWRQGQKKAGRTKMATTVDDERCHESERRRLLGEVSVLSAKLRAAEERLAAPEQYSPLVQAALKMLRDERDSVYKEMSSLLGERDRLKAELEMERELTRQLREELDERE